MTITDILRTLGRFRRLAVVVALLTIGLGALAAFTPADRYRSSTTVLVQPKLANGQAVSVQVVDFLVPSFVKTVNIRSFKLAATADLPRRIRTAAVAVSADSPTGTGILTITASSVEQEAVAPWAQAIADHLVAEIDSDFVDLVGIDQALPPANPYAPRRGVILAVTAVLAIVNALLAATIASAVRGRLDRVSELRDRFGTAVLGEIPRMRKSQAELGPAELLRHPGTARVVEALQTLRANVSIALAEQHHPWVVVTSTQAGEGKSLVASSLAWLLASVQRPTILVDGDSRRPTAHRRVGASIGVGLAGVGPHDLRHALQPTAEPHLRFLGAGSPDRHPAEIASTHLPHLLRQAGATGDAVIVDAPPLTIAAETIVYASACENVLLVIDARRRDLSKVERVITTLQDRDVHILGVVINRSRRKVRGSYYAHAGPRIPTSAVTPGRGRTADAAAGGNPPTAAQ